MPEPAWQDLGPVEQLVQPPLRQLVIGRTRIALSYRDGVELAVLQDGRAAQLCSESSHHPKQGADSTQGRQLHYHGRPG
jgi:hypothetical protein